MIARHLAQLVAFGLGVVLIVVNAEGSELATIHTVGYLMLAAAILGRS